MKRTAKMGAIPITDTTGHGQTLEDLAGQYGIKVETVRKSWARKGYGQWRRTTIPSPEQVAALFPVSARPVVNGKVKTNPAPKPKKERKPIDVSRVSTIAFCAVCWVIVMAHGVLIWYDCSLLWQTPGAIAGGIVFMVVAGALIEMTGGKKDAQSDNLLWFVWLLEIAAVFVHVPAFTENAWVAYARGAGEIYIWFLASTICICSAAAMFFYREKCTKK